MFFVMFCFTFLVQLVIFSAVWITKRQTLCVNMHWWMDVWTHASIFHFALANKSYYWHIVIFRQLHADMPAPNSEINQLLLQMIWFSHSPYSVRYDHPLWPEILQKSCYSSPLRYRMTPLGVQKGVRLCVCGSGVGERDREGERGGIIWADVVCWCAVCKGENGIDHFALPSLTLYY